jgi:hypothetical protein
VVGTHEGHGLLFLGTVYKMQRENTRSDVSQFPKRTMTIMLFRSTLLFPYFYGCPDLSCMTPLLRIYSQYQPADFERSVRAWAGDSKVVTW